MARAKRIGILTAGGDSPGLNAAIRGFGKAAISRYGMELIGFKDGFRGLAEDRYVELGPSALSGILTVGGTILGTSRDKPHRMMVGGEPKDMVPTIVETYERHRLDALVCLGGGGTAKNTLRLLRAGLNVVMLPKTIDNDIAMTDTTFGFSTALDIATEAIDRLHSTAHSHHRIIVTEIMGHKAGWLALGAGVAGGADVILLPEIPYSVESVSDTVHRRHERGMSFSILAVAEGARSREDVQTITALEAELELATDDATKAEVQARLDAIQSAQSQSTFALARQIEEATGLESRVSILGYVQRGGTPNASDRLLATRIGSAAATYVAEGVFGIMVASRGEGTEAVRLSQVAGRLKTVPLDHPWITAARDMGTGLGD